MKIKTAWALQSFFLCFFINLAFGALIFYMSVKCLDALNQWVLPITGEGAPALTEELRMALGGFTAFISQARVYLMPLLGVLTLAVTFILWLFVFLAGGRQIRRAGELPEVVPQPQTQPM
jgi:hypothetical protein